MVKGSLHELHVLEDRFDFYEVCRFSHLVCGPEDGHCKIENGHCTIENGHNHHSLCDSLLNRNSILVCSLYLGPGKDQIYPYCDFDIDPGRSVVSLSVSGPLHTCNEEPLVVHLFRISEIVHLSICEQISRALWTVEMTHMRR